MCNKCIIIGLDIEGTLLASKVALRLQKPFTFIIPAKSINDNNVQDTRFDINGYEHVLIMTDAIATWETINSTIQKYKLTDKVIAIYTILYRLPNINISDINLLEKTYSLNNDHKIEIVEKAKCEKRNSSKCMASNKKLK